MTCKQNALIDVQDRVNQYQTLFELHGDPIFKQALAESKLECEFINAISDDEHFVVTYAKILICSGLQRAAEERLDTLVVYLMRRV